MRGGGQGARRGGHLRLGGGRARVPDCGGHGGLLPFPQRVLLLVFIVPIYVVGCVRRVGLAPYRIFNSTSVPFSPFHPRCQALAAAVFRAVVAPVHLRGRGQPPQHLSRGTHVGSSYVRGELQLQLGGGARTACVGLAHSLLESGAHARCKRLLLRCLSRR